MMDMNPSSWIGKRPFRWFTVPLLGAAALLLLAGCTSATPGPTSTPEPSATPTPLPPRPLTVCLGQEPASLFPLGNYSSAARSVLAAVYDGPIDRVSYEYRPVILETLPSLENGDAQLFPASVYVGDEIVDADGMPVTLVAGTLVRPAGCRSEDCLVAYDGMSEIQLDQMQVTFRLLPGLTWSDGTPLSAQDSVFSYTYSSSQDTPGSKYVIDRTRAYEAADALTVQWWGKPGFVDPTYFLNFWMPLPEHAWGQVPVDQLSESEAASRSPLGWGPYVIEEWVSGEQISLLKNPNYFRAAEGLPAFDVLTFRFVSSPDAALTDLETGACDLLDPGIFLDGPIDQLQDGGEQGRYQALFVSVPVMEQLVPGIRPAAYDNGYNPNYDRPDFFGDVRTRQALALCIDRQALVSTVLGGLTSEATSFLPAEHPLYAPDLPEYTFDPAAAGVLLEAVGWRDLDIDPGTPRQAWGVANVPTGTNFVIELVTTEAAQRQQVSGLLVASLAQCGIQVNVTSVPPDTLYAEGPQGSLFGRNFQLAEFAMGGTGAEPLCSWFTSEEVPAAQNYWVGTNLSGYSSAEFDAACRTAVQSLPEEAAHAQAYAEAQTLFGRDLPVIPLYWRIRAAAVRSDFCNFALDPTAASALWNLEAFQYGGDCRAAP
jgi:peptide/nickel transport system substrate-binding protein